MHDKTGTQLAAEFEKPFKQALPINQSMMRPEFSREGLDPPMPPAFHQPPGAHGARVVRGRIGPKYESWSGQHSNINPDQRNCTCHGPRSLGRLREAPPLPCLATYFSLPRD